MEVLLVVPRYNFTKKKDYRYIFTIGLGYIAAVIKNAGHNLDGLNLNHFDGAPEGLISTALYKKKYDVVCLAHEGFAHEVIKKIIGQCKLHQTSPRVIIGGTLVTSESQLMFESLEPDFAVIGEGELTIVELLGVLEKKEDPNGIKGIIYRNNAGETIITPRREVINDLDSLPFPDFDSLGFPEYLDNQDSTATPFSLFDYPRPYPILCSRGCPFQCTFCYHSLGRKYRNRSIENIVQELKQAIKKYKINIIFFYDDLFAVNKERLYALCKEIKEILKEIPWDCKWFCQLSVQKVDDEMLKVLKDAGCVSISYGFESYNQGVLKSMNKPITPQQIDTAVKLTKKYGFVINAGFIFGDRAETKETARETLEYWKNNCDGQIQLNFIQPTPGSEIYEYCIKKGIIKDRLDFIKNRIHHTNWFNMTDAMTDDEIIELKKEIMKLRSTYHRYVVPSSAKKDAQGRYSFEVTCPYCNGKFTYPNCQIDNPRYYVVSRYCRTCSSFFYIVSPVYKLHVRYYDKLELLREGYISMRDKIRELQSKK